MTRVVCVLAALAATWPLPSWAAESDPAKIVERAIEAAGGRDNLAKFNVSTWNESGTYYGMGDDGLAYTGAYAIDQERGRFRMEIKGTFVIAVDGDKGWIGTPAGAFDMPAEQLTEQKHHFHAMLVSSLLPLSDSAYTLKVAGESKVAGRPTTTIVVTAKGQRDVKLDFDNESGLLVKSVQTVQEPEANNREVEQEVVFEKYETFDGAKVPVKMTVTRDGRKFVEAELSDLKTLEKLDDGLFAKP